MGWTCEPFSFPCPAWPWPLGSPLSQRGTLVRAGEQVQSESEGGGRKLRLWWCVSRAGCRAPCGEDMCRALGFEARSSSTHSLPPPRALAPTTCLQSKLLGDPLVRRARDGQAYTASSGLWFPYFEDCVFLKIWPL